jgi:DNA-binding transcriptional ArsR family regulator
MVKIYLFGQPLLHMNKKRRLKLSDSTYASVQDMIKEGKITSSLSAPASSSSLVRQTPEKDKLSRMLIIYSALDNEDRLKILFTIFNEPDISFNDISKKTDIDKSALAYHLGVLKRAGLVKMECQKRGKKTHKV